MTKEDALQIKKWRLEEGCTWRKIAIKYYNEENQEAGRALCLDAQLTLDERWED